MRALLTNVHPRLKEVDAMRIILLSVLLLILAGCVGGGGPSGKNVFDANCMTCHGATGKGDGPAATGLNPPPRDFTAGVWKYGGTQAEIEKTIHEGVPNTAMIAWKGALTEEEITAVAAYVKSLSK